MTSIVVLGSGLAGLRAAEVLREKNFQGKITLVGAEPQLPYNRPPLSKQFLAGEWDEDRIRLRLPAEFNSLDLDFPNGIKVIGLDLEQRSVQLSQGTTIDFDGLVIATGAQNRQLPALDGRPRVFTLRTLTEALALRQALSDAKSLLIVGGGFIGAEVAATAHGLGIRVCIVEPQQTLMFRGLGKEVGSAMTNLHREKGIDVRCNTEIAHVHDDGERTNIELSDGTTHTPDVILVGIGATPTTDWLSGSNVHLSNGVVCDENCRVMTADGVAVKSVVAAGDVARWFSRSQNRLVRSEHWTNAQDQAANAAQTLLLDLNGKGADALPYDPTPYVWSDQFGKKIQAIGFIDPADKVRIVKGAVSDGKFLAIMERENRFVGAIGVAMVPLVMQARTLLTEGASLDVAREKLAS
ncbi:MAG: FAD-dependent oxidoreductase [Actinobacteria bacterium]|nr:FAD-dependent oxidoreductase [Actinomycetota bacterium]